MTGPIGKILEKGKKLKNEKECNKNVNVPMRKVRIIYSDPDATDSSSDDDDDNDDRMNEFAKRIKRVVREVYIPTPNSSSKGSRLSVGVVDSKTINKIGGNEETSGFSPLPDHFSTLASRNEFREPTVKRLRDHSFPSLPPLFDYDSELYEKKMCEQLEREELETAFRWGKEEFDWYNSL